MRVGWAPLFVVVAACSFEGSGPSEPADPDAAPAFLDAAALACTTDTRYVNDGTISIRVESDEQADWMTARAVCMAEGGDLAVLDTDAKRTAAGMLTEEGHTWIGLTSNVDRLTWQWVDGTVVNVNIGQDGWGTDKPDIGPPQQGCARFRNDRQFDDEPCDQVRDFACECPL